MFPLGTVLLPGMVLPLHVFEPRYRALVSDCLASEPEFGVVLIDRGHEVGGGDVRRDVGTIARILGVSALEDGRSALVTVGTRRIRVDQWLADEPYPRAHVEEWPDLDDGDDDAPTVDALVARLRRVLAMAVEAGDDVSALTTEVADDPVLGPYHVAALAPLGPEDRFRVLCAPGGAQRRRLLDDLLADAEDALRFRLS
jgi:Lon protease-like protein